MGPVHFYSIEPYQRAVYHAIDARNTLTVYQPVSSRCSYDRRQCVHEPESDNVSVRGVLTMNLHLEASDTSTGHGVL